MKNAFSNDLQMGTSSWMDKQHVARQPVPNLHCDHARITRAT